MISMTSYSYEEVTTEDGVVSVEIKSVNSRFLDLSINMPQFLNPLESYFRTKISQNIVRGKVDVNIRLKELNAKVDIFVDESLVKAYANAIKQIQNISQLENCTSSIDFILNQPGVLVSNKTNDMQKYQMMIEPVFNNALEKFLIDAKKEGQNMKKDLEEKLLKLSQCALFFKEYQPKMENAFREQITVRFKELLQDNIDENRIMSETAAMVVKYTINEEIVRLQSHIDAMKYELENNETPGKKLDFICQEMNREINTIGSKNQFSEVGAMVICAKDALENIREQSKNIA